MRIDIYFGIKKKKTPKTNRLTSTNVHIGKTLNVDLGYLIENKILIHSRNREEHEQNPTDSLGNLMYLTQW